MSKEFFNRKAAEWDQMVNHNPDKIKKVLGLLPDMINPSILDVGSGTGILIPFLKERYGNQTPITALDFAEKMIEVSKEKHKNYSNLNFIVGDIYETILPHKHYDLIVCYSVFPHFNDKDTIFVIFNNLLKRDGHLLIFHSQSREAINNLHKHAGEEVKEDRLPPAEKIISMAGKYYFGCVKTIDNNEMFMVMLKKIPQE